MVMLNIKMPSCCAKCPIYDDKWDYPTCYITNESCGYNFKIHEKRMPGCPLKEMKKETEEIIKYCKICKKKLIPENTYKFKDGTLDQCCKMCRIAGCNDTQPWTFFPIMELFDIPYVEEEWLYTLRSAFQSSSYKTAFSSIFGKYLAKMYLKGWKNFGFKDSREINFWKLIDNKEKFKILRDFLLSKYSLDYQQFPDEYLEIIGLKEKKKVEKK